MGCADVCLDMDYEGSNEFYSDKMVKARKAHRCCECRESIPVGDTYHYACGKSDGDFWTNATCATCHEIRAAFTCGSWVFTQLWEMVCAEMFPVWNTQGPYDCLAKLTTPKAIKLCNDRYRQWRIDCDYDEEPDRRTNERMIHGGPIV